MTAITTETCDSITIDSTNWNVLNQGNVLEITINDDEVHSIEIPADNTAPFIILPEDLEVEEFEAGVYHFKLMITQNNGAEVTETVCIPVVCSLHCTMNALYTDIKNFNRIIAFEALKASAGCFDCSCATMNKLYAIANPTNDNDCGCQ